ncbi:MAG: mycothiol system anti-sigma-R factor [Acidimicrobiia bacterium]
MAGTPDDPLGSTSECDEALHELYHLLDGELTEERRSRILGHLERCGPCAQPYDFYADLRRVVQERCRDQAPPELLARVQAALDAAGTAVAPG